MMKTPAKKCSDHRTISLNSHTGKIVACLLNKILESNIKEVIEKDQDQLGFWEGKGTRDAVWLMRIISERVFDIKEEMCVCFLDWTKLLEMLKNTGVNWREHGLIHNLYMEERVVLYLNQGNSNTVETGRGVRQGCC